MTSRRTMRFLQAATMLIFAYLCVGELLPLPILRRGEVRILLDWQKQQVILLSFLSCLPVLLGRVGRHSDYFSVESYSNASLSWFFAAMNTVPVIAAVVTTNWFPMSSSCSPPPGNNCHYSSILFDTVGLVTARLARLNLGLCLLFATRGESAWLFEMTGGLLGFTEAIPIHRTAGWWCAGQSVLHSVAYVLFYIQEAGLRTLWRNCFPVPSLGKLNRLGLVNMFGLLACFSCLGLVLSAIPSVRRHLYHIFQRLHLPVAMMFVLCCALHDLSILLFGIPGLADWYLGWRGNLTRRRLPCKARLLSGTSGPWVELTVDYGEIITSAARNSLPPRGEWVSIKLIPLGREYHPLSVASICMKWSTSEDGCKKARYRAELSMFISSKAGDWSAALATLCAKESDHIASFQAEVSGPYPCGGGNWSLPGSGLRDMTGGKSTDYKNGHSALLLIAGGTGITGWLPALKAGPNDFNSRYESCHLVWCVKTKGDYLALVRLLPCFRGPHEMRGCDMGTNTMTISDKAFRITVYITSHDVKNVSDATHTSFTSELLDSVATKYTEENVDSSIAVIDNNLDSSRDTTKYFLNNTAKASPLISIAAVIIGLFAQHVIWSGWLVRNNLLGSPQTIIGLTVVHRVLPIALVIGCMMVTMKAVRYIIAITPSLVRSCNKLWWWCQSTMRGTLYMQLGNYDSGDGDGDCEVARSEIIPLSVIEGHKHCSHHVQIGRPDFNALVHEAAAPLQTREGIRAQLVVAACGPTTLVKAAENAVMTVKGAIDSEHVRVQFSPVDWHS